ncbi:ATP-dependent helicase HrpB [Paracoccus pantotrophus]|uniref:ATP-dependent helicase HrpB n=1 Tax=Paracoccus pantotrophus TaxID=82367 RepID=A0A1I5F2L2_PARPN|nr:ATP-dependent helicase HrpB [Paracoccus pantotrophus]MDF3853324.1 ATP-dependent helicase HrpB [Paracoccus pantotrophus]QFG37041.1 ATP-dependent helicase HrpB [Paracoccus pantotrophus]QLH14610.1 ATP-dependent helicase HrpB [Paracoccus pantotrophus]RDD98513.1 ATP-dependent helicase HrpB [Paracoccus pantotrophus]RKS52542.1 ATP-dependent helicase HrpB [Paracoccus pantotrophus]
MQLPIDAVLPDLTAALAAHGRAVLMAPPGAGKTTRVPLALLPAISGRILMLEPRRLAARAAAERMAETLGEPLGRTVGYRIRGEAVAGTRIEVVTEGILTRMIQSDPELSGIGCVIFDEFHERSLNADLGLALAWEARGALRPDLALLVMSATLDAEPVAALMEGAPVIRSEGRAFPVETRWLDRPLPAGARLVSEAARLITQAEAATRDTGGTILAFLPGEGEIRRVQAMLDVDAEVLPLYGAMDFKAQRAALQPPGGRRRIVLATAIAETSLTIPDVKVVVDAGRARRARFDPGSGMSRLVTERVSRAEAEQRRGRAGRVAPGICYRMWARAEEGALPAFAPPEIAVADLAGLALELAIWGSDGRDLAFLTPPPEAALSEARALLRDLGALDGDNRITPHGRRLAPLPLHPRLAHMLVTAGREAADLAALMAERDPLTGAPADLTLRLAAIRDLRAYQDRHPWPANPGTLHRIRDEAKRLRRMAGEGAGLSPGAMAALAYPDRIGLRRKGEQPRYVLSGGKGAVLPEGDALAAQRLIVATDLDGDAREARIRMAVAVDEDEIRALFPDRIETVELVEWSRRDSRVLARRQERLGALVLADRALDDPDPQALARAAFEGLRATGLTWSPGAARLRARVALIPELGPVDDESLLADPDWLLPWLGKVRTLADLRGLDLSEALKARIGWDGQRRLDQAAPAHFVTPLGRRVPIDYDHETPSVELKLQELFGLSRHPVVGNRPLRITLLSPGGKPVAVTTDLPGFWAGGYGDVRKDMRGRYPRHPWPENPLEADPTTRAKPRGT